MVNPTYPGVYVQEVASGVRPLAAAGTSTAAFVGRTQQGPTGDAYRVTSWTEFNRMFGGFISGSYLPQSVFQFFNNGGQQCYIVPLESEDDTPPTTADYQRAFQYLDNKTDFSLLAVPGVGDAATIGAGMDYCDKRSLQDVFFIGDVDGAVNDPEGAKAFAEGLTTKNSYGAIYFPWVLAPDPAGASSSPVALPPSGYIAGLYARIDARRGVWKAPAGTEAGLRGAVGLTYNLTDVQQGNLNGVSVNCLRRFPASGIVAWGARTLYAPASAEYNYISVRRTAIMLRVSIYNGIQWAVFEPNDEELWSQIRLNVRSFMTTQFRRGAFQGATPNEAFFVKCDAETTTQDDINLGIVNVVVGFAPVRPAEFVIVQISQKAGGNA